MKVKKTNAGNIIVSLNNTDMLERGISQAIIWPVLTEIAAKKLDLVGPVVATSVELKGEILIQISMATPATVSNPAAINNELINGFISRTLSTAGNENGAAAVEITQ
jgi:hypothetical protein